MADIKYEIKETLGELSESGKIWRKELNLISWNDKDAKYDIRDWSPEHEKMGKGITLSKEELIKLKALLNEINL
ncbi:MAG: YdbC family protein [Clostridium sp.]|uniref:YdbC family protein n=1 Tax=Clostridium sp. TaxID=1506 RepID=UPI003D6D5144